MKLTPEVQHLLERQAEWQRSRRSLSWPEKIRQAQQLLDSVRRLRRSKEPPITQGPSTVPTEHRA
jgi:hypothetical protein